MRLVQGMALISSLLMLAFLALVGAALLTTATIDISIGNNYRTSTQLLFLAEMGIAAGREALRNSPNNVTAALVTAAGSDSILENSVDLATLLIGDDQPLLPADPADRTGGQTHIDPTGRKLGTYHVFLRNDPIDGVTRTSDTNEVVTLLSIARIGGRTRTLEVDIRRGGFPPLVSALTLDGSIEAFRAADSKLFAVDGRDGCGGVPAHAMGLINDADVDLVVGEIVNEQRYMGVDPFPDIANVESLLPGNLTTTIGLEKLMSGFASNATDIYQPAFGTEQGLGGVGAEGDPRIVVVEGNLAFGPGQGYGVLVVRGYLTFRGSFSWNGLILIVGQGDLRWKEGTNGEVRGGIFIARTRGDPSLEDPVGAVLENLGPVNVDLNGSDGNGIYLDACALGNTYAGLPFFPVSIRAF